MQLTFGSEAAILISNYQPTSGNVGSVTGESGICANEGSGVETVSLAHSVQKLFPLPVLVATILNFGIQPKSGYVDSDISKSDLVEHVGVRQLKSWRFLKPFKSLFHFNFNF